MVDQDSPDGMPEFHDEAKSLHQRAIFLHKIYWAFWLVGTILIVLSWVDVVTPTIGWAGFGVALVGWALSKSRR